MSGNAFEQSTLFSDKQREYQTVDTPSLSKIVAVSHLEKKAVVGFTVPMYASAISSTIELKDIPEE